MPREDARTHLTRQWLMKASNDERAARLGLSAEDDLWDVVAFHSQQMAEKALKGFLAWHNIPFRKTHNLVELVEECAAIDASFASLRQAAQVLSKFAVDPRYPGPMREPDAAVADDALRRASDMMLFVLARLPPEVRP